MTESYMRECWIAACRFYRDAGKMSEEQQKHIESLLQEVFERRKKIAELRASIEDEINEHHAKIDECHAEIRKLEKGTR